MNLSAWLSQAVDFIWGAPLLIILLGGGAFLLFVSRFLPLIGMWHAVKLVAGKVHHQRESQAEGQITYLQGLSNALAATIGLGNIAGVAVAINQGGPGAIFWMWVAAAVGMNTKFFECTLAVMFRDHDYRGEVQGGPMYTIRKALGGKYMWLSYFFAICGLIGTLALFQANQLALYAGEQYGVEPIWVGLFCAVFVGIVLLGGVKRIAKVTGSLVPAMCVFYVAVSLVIIATNWGKVPHIFASIFSEAFSGRAAIGGAMGVAFIEVMKTGIKRAAFSNEAGIGTAPMAHSNVKTSEPVSDGLVAMLGPFLDTIIICTMTALVILTSLPPGTRDESGVLLTMKAFEYSLPGFGAHFLGVAILLFALTTMVGMANYNEKCWNFLFRGRWGLGERTFIVVFCLTLVFGAVSAMGDVVNLLDLSFALMAIPNMTATLLLSRHVKMELDDYLVRYGLKREPT